MAWRGMAWQAGQGEARLGVAWQGRRGKARLGVARPGRLGLARRGVAGLGKAGMAGRGLAGLGLARHGEAGMAGLGKARLGEAWLGLVRQAHNFQPEVNMSSNSVKKKLKAEVNDELARLNRERDGLRPSEVVDEAKSKESPLHSEFEWSDKKAGHEYRLLQARRLIRLADIVIEHSDGTSKVEQYVHVPPTVMESKENGTNEGVYRPVSVVVQNVDWYTRAFQQLASKMEAATRALDELRQAAETCENPSAELMAKIAVAMTALSTANAAVSALH